MSPHVTVSVSWEMSASSTVFSPTLPCHCILSPALNLAQCPTDILQGMGNRHITSGFEENLKCPISSFNVLSLCFVPTQWGRGNPFSLIVAGVRFTFHSLSILNRCFAMSWTVTRPGSSLTPHLEPQRPAWPSVTTSQVLWPRKVSIALAPRPRDQLTTVCGGQALHWPSPPMHHHHPLGNQASTPYIGSKIGLLY